MAGRKEKAGHSNKKGNNVSHQVASCTNEFCENKSPLYNESDTVVNMIGAKKLTKVR